MNSIFDGHITDNKTGFRLNRLEVLNWGTFDGKVYSIVQDGQNALLTGDIGSGKSTLVDAITTLLVPHNKIIYNKAAGAENRTERNLITYIRGEHTNKKDELTGSSKPVYLRDEDKFTVILGFFYNEGYEQSVTLAQVFWLKNNKPEKFFVISGSNLNIKEHFSNFDDIPKLRKRLRDLGSIELFDSFSAYSDRFRQLFGIKQPEALDLFYQTVSMKSVGNLTDFVRNQMLGRTEVKDKIEELIKSFDNLTETHNAVLKAKRQLEILSPLISDINSYDQYAEKIQREATIIDGIPKYFSLEKSRLLKEALKSEKENYFAHINRSQTIKSDLDTKNESLAKLRATLSNSEFGKQIESMETRIAALENEIITQRNKYEEYQKLCGTLGIDDELNEQTFYANKNSLEELESKVESTLDQLTIERDNIKLEETEMKRQLAMIKSELASLRSRKSQVPNKSLELRSAIAQALEINEDELPFAAELIRVRDDERDWEGAIERRLADFGLSLLVPEKHYRRIMNYVDKTDLKRKLVYLRMLDHDRKQNYDLKDNSLVHKVEVKSDAEPFADWIEKELAQKHDLACCETSEEYQNEYFAISKSGQIKTGRIRHEKDDRANIHDRRNYILGWSNLEKIEILEKDFGKLETELSGFANKITGIENKQREELKKKAAVDTLKAFSDFAHINFKKSVLEKDNLERDLNGLRNSKGSEQFKQLKEQVEILGRDAKDKEKAFEAVLKETGVIEDRITNFALSLFETLKSSSNLDQLQLQEQFRFEENIFENLTHHVGNWILVPLNENVLNPEQKDAISKLTQEYSLTVTTVDNVQKRLSEAAQKRKETINKESYMLANNIVRGMQQFKGEFQAEAADVQAQLEYIDDFKRIHTKVKEDDLPKHEEKFKKLLRENTIKELLLFNSSLYKFEKEIKRKIEDINNHLKEIDYNEGTYIKIIEDKVTSQDISEFKANLKKATEGVFGETELYSEDKFLEVKRILDRFKSISDEDKKWTAKVTDVRQWFTFGASERNRETDMEREYYSDSSGKSGGQKEKLAYTILASAIAYQFGLEFGETRSRSFRFVVIDEAFGRGSDDSTRYGLRLFEKLNLQLLIVTPLQKINIIEDYISAVHFVSNPNGNKSMVRNLTKSVYLKEKEEYFVQKN